MKKVLVAQYTEETYSMDQLIEIFKENMKNSRKNKHMVEFIATKPVFDSNGEIVDVTTDFPAEVNVYALQED